MLLVWKVQTVERGGVWLYRLIRPTCGTTQCDLTKCVSKIQDAATAYVVTEKTEKRQTDPDGEPI